MARLNKTMTKLEELEAQLAAMDAGEAPAAEPTKLEALEAQLVDMDAGKVPKKETSGISDFWEGVALSGMDAYYGVKDLVGAMDENERKTLEQVKKDASKSGWTTTGKVIGEVAQFAVPGGLALKGAKGAGLLKSASKLKNLRNLMAVEGATAGAVGGLRLPDEGETRTGNMLRDAAFGAGGAGIGVAAGKLLSKTLRGAKKSDEAIKLMEEGVELTPGQMSPNPIIRGLETVMEVSPFLASKTKAVRKRSMETWNKRVLQEAAPEGAEITEIGTKGAKQLKDAFNTAYDKAWYGSGKLSKRNAVATIKDLGDSAARLGSDDAKVLENTMREIDAIFDKKVGTKGGKLVDNVLRRRLQSTTPDKYDLTQALKQAKEGLRNRMPRNTQERLRKIDAQYGKYLTARDAVGRAKQDVGYVFKPGELTTSTGVIGKGREQIGEAALQETADIGRRVIGAKEGSAPLEWMRRMAGAVPSAPGMETAGRTLMGQTIGQKKLLELARSGNAQAIRELASMGGVSAGLAQ